MSVRKNSGHSESSKGSKSGSEEEHHVPPRHPRKPVQPKLNTWDIPEFLPGAMPGATPVQRALFEDRSVKVFKATVAHEALADEEFKKRTQLEYEEKVKLELNSLFEMFPKLEKAIIQESYLSLDNNMEATIQQMLVLSGESSPKQTPPRSDDETEFPVLTDKDGWQVVHPPPEFELEIQETRYRDKVVKKT